MALEHDKIISHLQEHLGEAPKIIPDPYGVLSFEVPVQQLYRLVNFLFKDMTLKFNNLVDLCGVHYPEQNGRELGVVYHLQSMMERTILRIKVFVPKEKPEVPSLTGIYASANWMERETYDFFGIKFAGHPDLRRILNMDEMMDYPLRKEFPLEDPYRTDKTDYHFGR